jgi:glucuronosyltransferase
MQRKVFCVFPVIFCLSLGLVSLPEGGSAAKILSIAIVSSKSHKITYDLLLEELAGRGHEVTVLSPIPSDRKIKNLREILTLDAELYMKDKQESPNFYEMKEKGDNLNPFIMIDLLTKVCNVTYDLPHVQELLKEKFDLVLIPALFNECAAGMAYKLNTSLVLISPVSAPAWVSGVLGTPSPASFVPNIFTGFGDKMTFYERTINFLATAGLSAVQYLSFKPAMEAVYRDKLNDPNIPSSDDIFRNASLILSNSHFSLSKPRPFLPDVVEVGGMHCRPAKPLPKVNHSKSYI